MKLIRTLGIAAVLPLALSLAACNSSNGLSSATGATANIRFVHGAPGSSGSNNAVDLYFTSTGTSISSTPTISGVTYGSITNFMTESLTAAQLTIKSAGTSTVLATCSLPQTQANLNYSVVIVNNNGSTAAGTGLGCALFNDPVYTSSTGSEVRIHHASPAAAALGASTATVAYGTYTPTGTTPASTFTVASSTGASFPGTTSSTGWFSASVAGPLTASSTPIGFAVGASGPAAGSTDATIVGITPSQFVTSPYVAGTTTPTSSDTGNVLPDGTLVNASLFAIDCPSGSTTTPEGTACNSGVALIGTFDSM
jgi:hypothetical protein